MSRVWKHFLKNLAWPVGFATYLFSVATGAAYADTLFKGGGLAVAILFVVSPILVYLVHEMWQDAKEKVKWENEETMRALKGE